LDNYIDYSGVQTFLCLYIVKCPSVNVMGICEDELSWVLLWFQHLLNCVVSRLLVSDADYCKLGDAYVDIVHKYVIAFLTEMVNMNHVMQCEPSWSNKANATSTLFFCQMIVRFGHLRRIWDCNRECYVTKDLCMEQLKTCICCPPSIVNMSLYVNHTSLYEQYCQIPSWKFTMLGPL
jgi:hypothetical protein